MRRSDARRPRVPRRDDTSAGDAPRDQVTSDAPPSWSFTSGPPAAPVRNRWAFFARGADCLGLHVSGPRDDAFSEQTFPPATKTFQVLPLPPDSQREVALLAGMGFLERRDPGAAL